MTLIGTGCVNARAAVQFLSEMARSASCLCTILDVLHSSVAAKFVVSSWV